MKARKLILNGLVGGSLLLTGCGGGGGGSTPTDPGTSGAPVTSGGGSTSNPPPATPSPGTSVTRGTITGFGSVFINGKRFATDNATFIVDGKLATEDDLSVGMLVNVAGDLSDGVASVVRFDEDVKGPVDSISSNELVVFGQTVRIEMDTVLDDNLSLAAIQVGDVLEVSGLRDANDVLVASYVERETGAVEKYEVIGLVRDLDSTAQTFRVGGLLVDYTTAVLDDLAGGLSDAQLVEVKDEQLVYTPGALTVLASKVEGKSLTAVRDDDDELDDSSDDSSGSVDGDDNSGSGASDDGDDSSDDNSDFDIGSGSELEVEALITALIGSDGFQLGSIDVRYSASTIFEYADASALQVGTKVEVEGQVDDNGVLIARKIEFSENEARVAGTIESIDTTAQSLQVFGVAISVSARTEIENDTDDSRGEDNLMLDALRIGDFVEVEGRAADASIVAEEIEIDELDRTELRGVASNVDVPARTLSMLGIDLVTDSGTDYEGFNDEPLSAQAFFDLIASGQVVVKAQWDEAVTDPSVPVAELELED